MDVLVVLVLAVTMANGDVYLYRHKQDYQLAECEKQLKIDEAELTPGLRTKGFQKFFWSCMTKDSYENTIKNSR